MAKRFTSTEIWGEDWFLAMPNEYKLFWYYMLAKCDHAGLFKVNINAFCMLHGIKLTTKSALEYFNNGKKRIRVISDGVWLIEDFFFFQYGNKLNTHSRVHESIKVLYINNNIELTSIRGLNEVLNGSIRGQKEVNDRVKDKDKDKE